MTKDTTKEAAVAAEALLLDDWFDAIEDGIRARARGFIETMLEEELSEALSRPRYGRRKPGEDEAAPSVVGVRHGHRERTLTGTFGKTRIAVPRARLTGEDGKTREWRSGSLRAYQRRTRAADALIAGAYLAGTNTRRVRRALNAVFAGPVGKDVVSRVWRKTKGDWDAWNARSLAEEPIVRLILDGTVARVRLDRRATSISLLVALGVRADGQKMLLAIKSMGGEGEAAWRALLDDLVRRGLRTPELVVIDGAPGLEKAVAALWPDMAVQRCTVHKHRNLLAHAPERLHEEISNDYRDMIYAATRGEVETRRKAFIRKWAPQMPRRRRQPGGSRRRAVHIHAVPAKPMEIDPNLERDRAIARGVQAPDQDSDRATLRRNRRHAVLGAARLRTDHHAQGRRMADPRRETRRSDH